MAFYIEEWISMVGVFLILLHLISNGTIKYIETKNKEKEIIIENNKLKSYVSKTLKSLLMIIEKESNKSKTITKTKSTINNKSRFACKRN